MIRDWTYGLNVYDSRNHRISPCVLELALRNIAADANKRLLAGESATPVGVLTADDRDRWAKVRTNPF